MPRIEIDVDPCDHITADAIGAPGKRIFYIQAYKDALTYNIIIEKIQLQSLCVGIEQFLGKLGNENPELSELAPPHTDSRWWDDFSAELSPAR